MATPDTQSSVVVYKNFNYRGSGRLWGNRYHFNGPLSITETEWEIFADAIVAAEKEALTDRNQIREVVYNDASTATSTNPHGDATWTKSYAVTGLVDTDGDNQLAGESCCMVRYSTDARSVKNKPIYLFNWYHGIASSDAADPDTVLAAIVTAMDAYGTAWIAGISDGTNTRVRCGPRGAVASARTVTATVRHRDFPT